MRPGISESTVERFRRFLVDDAARGRELGALDAFFDAASAALLLADQDLRCVQVNERLAHATGLSVEAHHQRPLTEVLPSSLDARLREVLRSGLPIDRLPLELRGRPYLATFFPVFADDASIDGLGGILIDVTEHKRLEAELRDAIAIRERVLAVVSHDLRNPLGTIQLAMGTLPEAARTDQETVRRIEIVERATKQMVMLIGDLLDIATIQTGTLRLQFADESADAIARDAVELCAALADEKGLTLVDEAHLAGV